MHNDDIQARIKALQMLVSLMPERAMFARALALSGHDADRVYQFVDEERMAMLRRISELQDAARLIAPTNTVVPFPSRRSNT